MKTIKGLSVVLFYLYGVHASAQDLQHLIGDTFLQVKPNRCIALHRGQECYQTLMFTWETSQDHKYCLYTEGETQPLACWQANKLKHFRHEFKAKEDQQFVLKDESLSQDVAIVHVDVAWVYKKGKKVSTGWRLF